MQICILYLKLYKRFEDLSNNIIRIHVFSLIHPHDIQSSRINNLDVHNMTHAIHTNCQHNLYLNISSGNTCEIRARQSIVFASQLPSTRDKPVYMAGCQDVKSASNLHYRGLSYMRIFSWTFARICLQGSKCSCVQVKRNERSSNYYRSNETKIL